MPLFSVPTLSRRTALAALAITTVSGLTACATHRSLARRRVLLERGDVRVDVIVDGVGPAIVLLPSSQRDSEDFDPLAARIAARGYQVLRPQPRGMGRSSEPPPDMTLATLAADVALSIERLAQGPAVVVGHAYGHWVARVADMNHPRLVRGVVVAAASAKVFPPGMAEALAVGSDPSKPVQDRIEALKKSMFAPGNDPRPWLEGWHPKLRAAYRQAGQKPAKDVWFNTANAPILDLQGELDPWRPASTRNELKDVLGDKVTIRVIANASHALIPEQPEAVVSAIVGWVRTLKS
jgi:pimeloyl-ACP methyl ester carboxylesterase